MNPAGPFLAVCAVALAGLLGASAAPRPVAPASPPPLTALPGESRITYYLRHPLHDVSGTSRHFRCEVVLGADTARARVHVSIPVTDFNSGNSTRDANMLEALEAFRHPFVEFTSDSLRREGGRWRIFGSLYFHGVRRPIDFTVVSKTADGRVRVRGGFFVRLSDYGVSRPTLLRIPARDSLRIEMDLRAPAP